MGRHEATKPNRSWTRRSIAGFAALAAAAGVAFLAAPDATAGTLPSTTKLTATPATEGVDGNIHFEASVKVLNLPGLGVVPTGTVTFTANTIGLLGTAPLDTCVLKVCKAKLDVNFLPVGTSVVTASWPGDQYGAPSDGSTTVVVNTSSYSNSSTIVCPSGQSRCDAGLIESTDGGTWADFFTQDPATVKQTLTEKLGGTKLKCADPNAGAQSTFTDQPDPTGVFKTLLYTVTDPTQAANVVSALNAHLDVPRLLRLARAVHQRSDRRSGAARRGGTTTYYEAPLPRCYEGTPDPCFTFSYTDQYGQASESAVTIHVFWQKGVSSDPKYVG